MKSLSYIGAYYIGLEAGEQPEVRSVRLNGREYPIGSRFAQLGNPAKKRTCFQMQTGWQLEFRGWHGNYLLFKTWHPSFSMRAARQLNLAFAQEEPVDIFYAFGYVDEDCLMLHSGTGCADIRY